jgi:predicted RNA binding protein YcfA (HicA-like mRNA interferase family)
VIFQKIPELSYKEVVTGLKKLGFQLEPKKSTGHE